MECSGFHVCACVCVCRRLWKRILPLSIREVSLMSPSLCDVKRPVLGHAWPNLRERNALFLAGCLLSVTVSIVIHPRLFETLVTLTFRALGRNHSVNTT